MKMINDMSDSRHNNGCIFCSRKEDTRDHIPARAFLSRPYPENLHVLPVCKECNNKFSLDEEYTSFLVLLLKNMVEGDLDDQLDGFTHCDELKARILRGRKSDQIDNSYTETISIETERVKNVLNKYAFAHFCFERGEHPGEAIHINFAWPNQISNEQLELFNETPCCEMLPEVGSRLFQRILSEGNSWQTVQDGRYRYYVDSDEFYVKIVINEYLFAEIIFNEIA